MDKLMEEQRKKNRQPLKSLQEVCEKITAIRTKNWFKSRYIVHCYFRLKKHGFRNPENANQAQVFILGELSLKKKETSVPATSTCTLDEDEDVDNQQLSTSIGSTPHVASSGSYLFKFLNNRIATVAKKATITSDSIIMLRQYLGVVPVYLTTAF
ncbi:unnamed protein product [Brassicogethes aeneus]|uniref:Uncharacterized protein n=1 Tax=Brassicogethes aeneus TaxID=1431903 RepID=A0A9P0BCC6_BRAAE|nr:unnamed protein product [Brassicogethes aeneus]